jgi:WD40 repeat protein
MDNSRRQSGATSASGLSSSNDRQLSVRPVDWEEPRWPEFPFTFKEPEYSKELKIPPSTRPRRLSLRRNSRRCFDSVGFSPNCKLAFVLGESGAFVYLLGEPPDLRPEICAELNKELLQPSKGEVIDAVLSNRYFATVDRYKLDMFGLDEDGHLLDVQFSTSLENQVNGSNWVPTCLAIFDDGGRCCAWVAVGFRVKKDGPYGGDIKVYRVEESGIREEIGRYDNAFRSTIERPLSSESVRRIAFSPDGDRLVCVTNNNTVLIWSWSHPGESWRPPLEIRRDLIPVR